jgi:hypothetical protein
MSYFGEPCLFSLNLLYSLLVLDMSSYCCYNLSRWIEFAKKSVAKRVANLLNGEQIGVFSIMYCMCCPQRVGSASFIQMFEEL